MPITDLTNTSWYFNETLDHFGISNQDSFELGSYEAEFMINYYAGNHYPYTSLYFSLGYSDCVFYDPNYDPTFDFVPYEGGMWTDEDCRTIFITGGEDVTNPDLISWLTQNATQVENPTIITDLTNTSWRFNDTLEHWGIGEPDEEDLVRPGRDSTFNASFTSNNASYTSLSYSLMGGSHGSSVQYSNSESETYDTVWEGQWNVDPENNTEGWSEGSSWNDEVYRTITITGGDDATNPKFIVWLTKNATQVSIEDTPSGITISYNDTVIATVQPGETATLECAGMMMDSNIVVEAPEASGGGGNTLPKFGGTVVVE